MESPNSSTPTLTIGEVARRTGVATSALRFYESLGLIGSVRTDGNQRRYARSTMRVVSIIRAAQGLGMPLEQIGKALGELPASRTPTPDDWARMSSAWREDIDSRIAMLTRLRDTLDGCIGCGCLSLDRCGLFNRGDNASRFGPGARYLMGDKASDIPDPNLYPPNSSS